MKTAVVTFGCRVNQADSLSLEAELRAAGATSADPRDADVVVVNTCSVTASADQSARQIVRQIARVNPAAKIVVTGCYATRRPDEVAALPNVARLASNDEKAHIVSFIRSELTTAERFGDGDGSCGAPIEPGLAGRTAFTLRVQTGCAEPCAYCIIPTTRGRPQSLPIDEVLAQTERIAAAGFKEVVLTGVHLGSYGHDLSPRSSLAELLRALDAMATTNDGARAAIRFRISSLEPMDCTDAVVELVERSAAFAPHFHLPLQHASNRILQAMRRPYTIEEYSRLVDRIARRLPHASIGTDVIVGFPGERDEDADALAGYLSSAPLSHVHVFPYSDRPGTEASRLAEKVAGGLVRERSRRMREIAQRLQTAFRDRAVGTLQEGLTLEDGTLVVTGNYLKLRIPPGRARNEWVRVRVTSPAEAEVIEPFS